MRTQLWDTLYVAEHKSFEDTYFEHGKHARTHNINSYINLSMPPSKHQLMKTKLNENPFSKKEKDLRKDFKVKFELHVTFEE